MSVTTQEFLDFGTQKILEQGKPAIASSGMCKYRLETPEGILKCFAGHWIKDEEYKTKMENMGFYRVVANFKLEHLNSLPEDLIYEAQQAHDLAASCHRGKLDDFLPEFKCRIREVYRNFGCNPAILDKHQ